METGMKLLIDLADQECLKGSLNGPSLLETLQSLSPAEAASTDTYEGYSAWTVALHVLYLKHLVSREFGAALPPYEYEETDFPKPPAQATQAEWDKVISLNEAVHRAFVDALSKATTEKLEGTFKAWKMPLGKAVAWLVSHDIAHNAQIRNMGLPSLKSKKG